MPSSLAAYWNLDPGVTFLNHGSFGACPATVLSTQSEWRALMESDPVAFLGDGLEAHLDQALSSLAAFLGAAPQDLVFVPNATTGVNAVLRSLRFQPGDQLLTTNHAYTACRNALEFVARRWDAAVAVAEVPFVGATAEGVVAAVMEAVTPRTRLAMLDHVTSPTGMVLPVEQLVRELQSHGVEVLVDGAHGPGMLPIDLSRLGASYYTGNCHKWMCAPKGAGFLWVEPGRQGDVVPTTISHGAGSPRTDRSRYQLNFAWTGTVDPTAYLSAAAAIKAVAALSPDGWRGVMASNHQLVVRGRDLLCAELRVEPPVPDAMLGSLASIPLPEAVAGEDVEAFAANLHSRLRSDWAVQVPIVAWSGLDRPLVRISAHLYNSEDDYARLADALSSLMPGSAERAGYDAAMAEGRDSNRRSGSDRRSGGDRRNGGDRRSGADRRERDEPVERERRSRQDRRTGRDRRSGERRSGSDRRGDPNRRGD